jgi:hypothetical protein
MLDYGDMVIATKKEDSSYRTIDGWAIYSCFTMLFLSTIGGIIGATFVIGIAARFIGWIVPIVVIGLGFWACNHYGTNHSILDRWRYRTTKAQRAIILRRLSGEKKAL